MFPYVLKRKAADAVHAAFSLIPYDVVCTRAASSRNRLILAMRLQGSWGAGIAPQRYRPDAGACLGSMVSFSVPRWSLHGERYRYPSRIGSTDSGANQSSGYIEERSSRSCLPQMRTAHRPLYGSGQVRFPLEGDRKLP